MPLLNLLKWVNGKMKRDLLRYINPSAHRLQFMIIKKKT